MRIKTGAKKIKINVIKNIITSTIHIFARVRKRWFLCAKIAAVTKKETEEKKELARLYFMQGESQKSIATRLGVSEVTIGRWSEKDGWKIKRASMNVTRPEIVNKNLMLISKLLDKLNSEDVDMSNVGKIIDQISKLAAAIERIDKKANVIDAIEVFTSLNKWLEKRMEWDKNVTPELLQTINKYQDLYINDQVKR